MKTEIKALFNTYVQKGVLVDANILLVFLVGTVNQKRILSFKRTNGFTIEDYELLGELFSYLPKIVTTPNILTEVSNLGGSLNEPERSQFFIVLRRIIPNLVEHYVESKQAANDGKFTKLGLTDAAILSFVKGQYLVLTTDLALANNLQTIGVDVVNFNNLRFF